MSDIKASIIFIALSAVLLIGIGLLPETPARHTETTMNASLSGIVQVNHASYPGTMDDPSAGWKVTVKEY